MSLEPNSMFPNTILEYMRVLAVFLLLYIIVRLFPVTERLQWFSQVDIVRPQLFSQSETVRQ